ncbi:MAG: hypothetical protein ACR2P4_10505 [Gammaproteobacteria bacterium]
MARKKLIIVGFLRLLFSFGKLRGDIISQTAPSDSRFCRYPLMVALTGLDKGPRPAVFS